jgi:TolA-binding protein
MKTRLLLSLTALLAAGLTAHAAALDDARELAKAGKLDEAITKLEGALRAGGAEKPAIAVELARTQVAAGRLISAQQTVDRFLRESPNAPQKNAMAYLNARLREAGGNIADAVSLYRTVAEQTPAVPERADALADCVRAAALLNNVSMAVRCLAEFTESFPQDPRTREFLLRLYRQLAAQNDHRGAADTAHRFKAAFPQDPAGAAFTEFYHHSAAGDYGAAVATFQAERKLPTFTLNASVVSTAIEAMRRHTNGYALIAPLAEDFVKLTGDPQFQVAALEYLPDLALTNQAVALGGQLLPKLANTAWGPRVRLAHAYALRRAANFEEAEKQLVALLAIDPANSTAWDRHAEVTSLLKRPEAHVKLLEETAPKLAAQKNLSLRLAAQGQIAYRLTQAAWNRQDYAAVGKLAAQFLDKDGLSSYGPQVIKLVADAAFAGLPEATKADAAAAEALKTAKANHQKATGDAKRTQTPPAAKEAAEKALATAKDALDKAQAKADATQKTFEETRAKSLASFDALLPALEKYLTRTAPWNGALASVDTAFKPHFPPRSFAAEQKKLNELLQRVRQHDLVKPALANFQTARTAGQWARAGTAGEALLPKLLEGGPALALEGGGDVLVAMYNGGQYEKGLNAGRQILAKHPGASGVLYYLTLCANQLGAPKNRDAVALVDATVAQAGGSYWPYDGWGHIRSYTFAIAEQNRQADVMLAEFKHLGTLYPGSSSAHDSQRRIGAMQASLGQNDAAKQTLLAAVKAAQPMAAEPATLHVIATAFTNAADWALPALDAYLARPNRGPAQGGIQLLRGHLLLTEKKDTNAAIKSVQLASARPGDFAWTAASVPWQWGEALLQTVVTRKVDEAKPADVALLTDLISSLGAVQAHWLPSLLLRQAQTGQALDATHSLNRLTVGMNPNDANWLGNYYIPWSQQLASLGKPELSGLVLRSAVSRFTGVDPKLRAQASQALFSLSSKHGFPAAEIDEKLEWAPLLKSAMSFRMGDPIAAWKAFQANEALFAKHEDKLPADYLRWTSDRLLQRDDEASRDTAERILRRWIIANENSKAVPEDEKAKTQLALADYYFKTLRYDLARSECTSLMNRFPTTSEAVDAQFRIGECYLQQKMYVDAAKVFEKMAKSKDKLAASRGEFLLGVLAQQRGDVDDAKARFRNVMDLAPSSDVADGILYRLSELYGQENRFRDELMLLRSIGLIGSSAKQWHPPGLPLNIVIQDADLGVSRGQSYVPVVVTTSGGDREVVRLESGSAGKGFFRAELPTELGDAKPGDNILQVNGSDTIIYDYPDDFKKQFTAIAPPRSNIRLAADAEFKISATEIKDEEEVSFEERLRLQRQQSGKQAGLEFRQEFRTGNSLKPGNNVYLQVKDGDRDVSKEADAIKVLVTAASGSRVTATLTETGPHTGIFRGTLKTVEIAANTFASDRSIGNEAVRAIDNNPKTSWEGLNDGRAPKFIVVDLKQPTPLGELKWSTDGFFKDKKPVEYAIQTSTNLTDWTTVAATTNFTGSTAAQRARIVTTNSGNFTSASIQLTNASGRYVRLFIEKFSGTAPRIAEIEVKDAAGTLLIPTKSEAEAVAGDSLRLTPSDRVTAAYDDETSMISQGKPRALSQSLVATYYNAQIGYIAYDFKPVAGQNIPETYVKQVRRVEPGQRVIVRVTDYDADNTDKRDKIKFTLKTSDGQEQKLEATETEPFTGVFTKELDIWSEKRTNGFKLGPGVSLDALYLDEQNTDPGAPTTRATHLEAAAPGDVKVAFVPSAVKLRADGTELYTYASTLDTNAPAIKAVAFRPPLTFEIIDPEAARDSFSEVKATLTTSGGSTVEVICPLSNVADGKPARRRVVDDALETGRFVGQILMNLGDKDSPPTIVLEPGDTRVLAPRRNPAVNQEQQLANVVPVLNLNGQDVITVTYKAQGKEFKDQARLAVPASVEFTDSGYDKPVTNLYIGDKIFLVVKDLTADATPERDNVEVTLTSSRGEKFTVKLQETLSHSGEFSGSFPLVAGEKPAPADDRMEAWFGDAITLTYTSKSDATAKFEKTINVVKGTDGNLLVFEKKYATEKVAIESQFRMAEAYFELFKNFRALKQLPQATNALSEGMQLLKELSNDYPSKQYEARTDYLLGQFAQELKKYDEAIAYYKRIVQNHSDHPLAPDAQYKLGQCHEEKNDMDAASAEYVTLAYTWPENPLVANVVVRIAEYFYNKKEYPTAAEVSKKFVERFPQHEWAERMLFRAGQCWYKAEQFGKAGKEFDLLVDNYPRSKFRPDAIFWAGESYRTGGQLESAFRRYKRATWDYPESDAAKFARGKLVLPEMVNIAERDVVQ